MRIGLLGAVEVHVAGGVVALPGVRLRGLLARLALDAGRPVSTSVLVEDLWGEQPPGANALQALVSRLRRTVGATHVTTVPGGYRLDPGSDPAHPLSGASATGDPVGDTPPVDAAAFADLLARAGRATAPDAHLLLGRALALWRGPALADLTELPFTAAVAARLEEHRATAVEEHARLALQLGARVDLAALTAQLDALPLRETTATLLGRGLHAAGRQADALTVLDRTTARLADELGVDPGPELAGARQDVLRGGAPVGSGLSSFVGREGDVARVGALLDTGRLVTLTGPGGAGKTRLAREATAGRSVVAELAALTTAQQLPDTLLAAVGEPELVARLPGRPQDTTDRLLAALDGRDVLLVLDNCEHLVDGVARLVERLLERCPRLRVLATSREPLGVPGEVLHPVDALADDAAARLFADRAAAVAPAFTLDTRTQETVATICRRLDGQPLPIELAASRLRTLSPAEILDRLDDRFRLLTLGSRTALPRHQTLRAVVGWSWDLLDEQERAVARRLAAFAGGATVTAAERVCGPETFERLTSLVDKSLVVVVPQPDGAPTRYRMLETIRAYAAERLEESGERAAAHAAHAAFVVDLVEEAEPHIRRREQLRWLAVLRAEADEIDVALRRTTIDDGPLAYRIVAATAWAWFVRGRAHEIMRGIDALPPPADDVAAGIVARIEACRSVVCLGMGDLAGCRRNAESALDRIVDLPRPWHPFLQLIGPVHALFVDRDDRPLRRLGIESDDRWVRAFALLALAQVAENDGDREDYHTLLRAAHTELAAVGDRLGLGMVVLALGELEDTAGEYAAAAAAYAEAATMARELGNEEDLPQFLARSALLEARRGDVAAARTILDAVAELPRSATFGGAGVVPSARSQVERLAGDLGAARAQLTLARQGSAAGEPTGRFSQLTAYLGVLLAQIEVAAGRPDAARTALCAAIEAAIRSQDGPVCAVVAEAAAQLAHAEGDLACAALLLGIATTQRGRLDIGSPDVCAVLAGVRAGLGVAGAQAGLDEGAALPRADGMARLAAFGEARVSTGQA